MRRRGFTLIEIMMVIALIVIMTAMALPKVSFLRYRQDAAGRQVQRCLINAQQKAMQKNTNVLFVMDYSSSRMRIVQDTNANGAADAAERWVSWALPYGAMFAIPAVTVDGATSYYATGPGVSATENGPTITFYPNGSASGDAMIYVGVSGGGTGALRAIEFAGSTGRSRLWRYVTGSWKRDSL